jgi:hypothetical protein
MVNFGPLRDFVFTDHALAEMARRDITKEEVMAVLAVPEQMEEVRTGRVVYHARLEIGNPPKTYLMRVFVDIDFKPCRVVTVYRTSKVDKYWR